MDRVCKVLAVILCGSLMAQSQTVRGESFPTLTDLVSTNGFPIPPLEPNPIDNVFQWIFPSLTFVGGLNITGWLFQAEMVDDSTIVADERAPLFTLWTRDDAQGETGIISDLTRRNVNNTRPSSIRKIAGTSPPLYFYELEKALATQNGDTFGILGTNQTIAIHFTNTSGVSDGQMALGDVSALTCPTERNILNCHISNRDPRFDFLGGGLLDMFPYLPLATPVFGDSLQDLIDNITILLDVGQATTPTPTATGTWTTPFNSQPPIDVLWIIVASVIGLLVVLVGVATVGLIAAVIWLGIRRRRRRRERNEEKLKADSNEPVHYRLVIKESELPATQNEDNPKIGGNEIINRGHPSDLEAMPIVLKQNAAYGCVDRHSAEYDEEYPDNDIIYYGGYVVPDLLDTESNNNELHIYDVASDSATYSSRGVLEPGDDVYGNYVVPDPQGTQLSELYDSIHSSRGVLEPGDNVHVYGNYVVPDPQGTQLSELYDSTYSSKGVLGPGDDVYGNYVVPDTQGTARQLSELYDAPQPSVTGEDFYVNFDGE